MRNRIDTGKKTISLRLRGRGGEFIFQIYFLEMAEIGLTELRHKFVVEESKLNPRILPWFEQESVAIANEQSQTLVSAPD